MFKRAQTHSKRTFPGWKESPDILEWCTCDDRNIDFHEILEITKNQWFSLIFNYFGGSVKSQDLDHLDPVTESQKTWKMWFKLSQTAPKRTFPRWKKSPYTVERCTCDDRNIAFHEILEITKNQWFSLIFIDFKLPKPKIPVFIVTFGRVWRVSSKKKKLIPETKSSRWVDAPVYFKIL